MIEHGGPVPAEHRAWQVGLAAFGPGWQPAVRASAPGRIELLGNHLDYNGGPVLAAAIDRFVVVLAAESDADGIEVVAADPEGQPRATLDPSSLVDWQNRQPPPTPVDYVRGSIAAVLNRHNLTLRAPCRLAVAGDVPIGLGLSSSAALCVALTLALTRHSPVPKETILSAQEAEHRAGTPCGTMDQSASVTGGVIRYDGATLAIERLSPDLGDLVFAVADSGVQRSLGASSYPARVEESRRALAIARRTLGDEIPSLAALSSEQFALLDALPETDFRTALRRRVRHVVTETDRVERGIVALRTGDWITFGRLMTASGRSSAADYEISHPWVEGLVSEILQVDGVLGARMMGGGEGGSVLALLPRMLLPELESALLSGYYARHGMESRSDLVEACAFAEGARVEATA